MWQPMHHLLTAVFISSQILFQDLALVVVVFEVNDIANIATINRITVLSSFIFMISRKATLSFIRLYLFESRKLGFIGSKYTGGKLNTVHCPVLSCCFNVSHGYLLLLYLPNSLTPMICHGGGKMYAWLVLTPTDCLLWAVRRMSPFQITANPTGSENVVRRKSTLQTHHQLQRYPVDRGTTVLVEVIAFIS